MSNLIIKSSGYLFSATIFALAGWGKSGFCHQLDPAEMPVDSVPAERPVYAAGSRLIKHYSYHGLRGSRQVWSIAQDKTGMLYLGMQDAILQFDGQNWWPIHAEEVGAAYTLLSDENGRIWVGGVDQFGYLTQNRLGQTVYRSLSEQLPVEERSFGIVGSIQITSDRVYFFSRYRIFCYTNGGQLSQIAPRAENDPFSFGFIANNKLYVQLFKGGLAELRDNQLHLLPQTAIFSRGSAGWISVIADGPQQLLIVTDKKGLFHYDTGPRIKPDGVQDNEKKRTQELPSTVKTY